MNPVAEDILMHYGVKRRSGRYPWGSGKEPYQRSGDFLSRVNELKAQNMSEKDIAQTIGLSTTDLRMQIRVANHERRDLEAARAKSLRSDGKSLNEIAEVMGYKNDSSIRSLLNEETAINKNRAKATAEILKERLKSDNMLEVGAGVERELGCSENTLKEALFILETEGYNVYGVGVHQATDPNPGKQTINTVLANPDVEYKYAYEHLDEIMPVEEYHSTDGGTSYNKLQYPASIDASRVSINYGDEGGTEKDGVIELRRGVADLDLGNSHYAQVRILVDGTHYLKGMAMYADDIPEGADIRFNTNKKSGTDKMKVLKGIEDDPDNPFGAAIKAKGQSTYFDADGVEHLSAINKLKEEGDWDKMSRNLSSQFLSKQPIQLINQQLKLTYEDIVAEHDSIMELTNPTIKRKLLMDFANECESAAMHLKAAAFPRQSTQVILPLNAMKENEIYAPNYNNGEKVVLIRYPHGGQFEIPELVVNNKNKIAKEILGNVRDAVGINAKVAEQLSGADFDGDQVVVIPVNSKVRIQTKPKLSQLEGFDPKTQYPERPGMRYMSESNKQKQMGVVSNLITDMTLRGAPPEDIARAVKHSMVVIDAYKHKLDYKKSEQENGIAELKNKWQVRVDDNGDERLGGASTLLSRRKQTIQIPETKGSGRIDPETGKMVYKTSGRVYVDKTGKTVEATQKANRLQAVDDAYTLSSGTVQENAYADFSNKMKAMSNQARKETLTVGRLKYDSNAKVVYQKEVASLNAKLNTAAKNAPRERYAQRLANSEFKAKEQANQNMTKDEKKKTRQVAINNARATVGASGKDTRIDITDREWEAIQGGAITDSKLTQILRYSDPDKVKQRATPKTAASLSTPQVNKAKRMAAMGYTNAEIAKSLGKSASTISRYLNDAA